MQILSHKLTTADGEFYNLSLSAPRDSATILNPQQPIILCLPAMGVAARNYLPLAESLNRRGFVSALFELRGIGSSSVRASRKNNFGYDEILSIDLPEAIRFIRVQYPQNPIYLLGHSLGGQLAMLYMSVNPDEIAGLIGVASGSPYFKGWQFPYNLGIFTLSKVMPIVAKGMGYFPGRKLGFGGRESHQLVKDWAHSVVTGNYKAKNNPHDFEGKIEQLVKNALMISIDEDVLAPTTSGKNLGDKLKKGTVTYRNLEKDDFKENSLGHFNWMKEPEPITNQIIRWLSFNQ